MVTRRAIANETYSNIHLEFIADLSILKKAQIHYNTQLSSRIPLQKSVKFKSESSTNASIVPTNVVSRTINCSFKISPRSSLINSYKLFKESSRSYSNGLINLFVFCQEVNISIHTGKLILT